MKFSASITTMFKEHAVLDRPAAAKQAGFDAIEIQLLEAPVGELARAARNAGVQVVLLNAGLGDLRDGGPGLSGVPGREQDFREEFARTVDNALLLGCRAIHAGPCRLPAGTSRDYALKIYRENLLAAASRAASAGIQLLFEPINTVDLPGALLSDVREAAAMVRGELAGKVGLQFDVYHVAMTGDDVLAAYADCRDVIRHIQFSDLPGRVEPGAGKLDFAAIFAAIEASGYTGWVGAEYTPSKTTADSLQWLVDAGKR
ncbi:MAG: TIM barrel protein [Gammaproteobacteria bacterium]|nr:TIM barrel protein [Gammaproteobacteria bacterium]